MFEAAKEITFSAAHRLENYQGACERLHGHNWKVRAFVRAHELDPLGLVVDFAELKDALKKVVSFLDHQILNDLPAFSDKNPSAENMAKYIYEKAAPMLNTHRRQLVRVEVFETETSMAAYFSS